MLRQYVNKIKLLPIKHLVFLVLLFIVIASVTYNNDAFAITYHYEPFFNTDGTTILDIANDPTLLQLTKFTVATWFKTTANFPDEGVMVNKGGLGSESAGKNQNYGLWFTPDERLQGGYESTSGSNKYITSTTKFNDGQWHHGVVTYDGFNVKLFVDGKQIGSSLATTTRPDNTGSQPLRIAGNAQSVLEDFFVGQLDEVGVWNRALMLPEISNLMNDGFFATSELASGLVFSNSFDSLPTPEICGDGIDNDLDGEKDEGCPPPPRGYHYEPFFNTDGTTILDIANDPTLLQLTKFTVATWFKTTANFPDEGVMVNKGGLGSESAGKNQNYGLWFTPDERLQGGYESTSGSNKYITSTTKFNDGQWHHGVVTYDGFNVKLFVDGKQIGSSLATTTRPDNTGSQPLRIAGNAQSVLEDFFVGQLDEVGVWNRALMLPEISNLMNDGFLATSELASGLVFSNSFDSLPTPEICGDGIDNDLDGEKDEGCPPPPPPPLNFKFAYKFGTKGTGNGQFQDPHDVSFDSSGNVFVPDRVRSDIQKFTHEGVFISKFGGPGSGPGQFNVPYSIAHDSNNNIYVSDRENNRIQKLTNDGVFITELKSINGKNFVMPEDLAFDFTNGDLYITDTGNNRIVKLDKNHNFILEWGSKRYRRWSI